MHSRVDGGCSSADVHVLVCDMLILAASVNLMDIQLLEKLVRSTKGHVNERDGFDSIFLKECAIGVLPLPLYCQSRRVSRRVVCTACAAVLSRYRHRELRSASALAHSLEAARPKLR